MVILHKYVIIIIIVIIIMAAILRDSVVVRTRPRAIPLAMITMRKFIDGFPFFPYEYGAPLCGPSGRRSSAINDLPHYLTYSEPRMCAEDTSLTLASTDISI